MFEECRFIVISIVIVVEWILFLYLDFIIVIWKKFYLYFDVGNDSNELIIVGILKFWL